jgi:hypothetical protein
MPKKLNLKLHHRNLISEEISNIHKLLWQRLLWKMLHWQGLPMEEAALAELLNCMLQSTQAAVIKHLCSTIRHHSNQGWRARSVLWGTYATLLSALFCNCMRRRKFVIGRICSKLS